MNYLTRPKRRVKKGTEGGTPAHSPLVLPLHRLLALLEQVLLSTKRPADSSFDSLSDVQAT